MSGDHSHPHAGGIGHNGTRPAAQWQTPHLPDAHHHTHESHGEPDLDLVEAAFVEGFSRATDPTSFLRLAGVSLEGKADDGKRLCLLRVEIGQTTDVGSLSPYLGGAGHRYDPLPAKMVSKREVLTFVYFDGEASRSLTLAETRDLDGT